jgi:Fur family transcriptional regulator, ferric uptake regulator
LSSHFFQNEMIASTSSSTPSTVNSDVTPLNRELLVARLKSFRLRVTAPRIALLHALAQTSQPSTIEQLFVKAGSTTCDLVTIYRSMAAFEKAGVVYRSGFSERGAALYNADVGGNRRYPVVRKGSAVVEELDSESSAELQAAIDKIKQRLQARGYAGLQHIVEFFAVSSA